jgi:large subunit ribosomal protein L10
MPTAKKTTVVEEIEAKLGAADAAVLTEYRGLTVSEIANLRAALRPAATDYKVFKNTLARRAASDAGLAELVAELEGPVAIAFVRQDGGDAVTAAKALRDFARGNPNLIVKGGILGDRLLTTKDVEALADVPPRDELLARLAGGFQAPLTKAAGLFQAFTRNFAYGLKAYADQRADQEPEAAAPAAASEESREAIAAPAADTSGESDHEQVAEATEQPEPATEVAPETTAPEASSETE